MMSSNLNSGLGAFMSVPDVSLGRGGLGEVRCGPTGGEAEREDMGSGSGLSSVLSPRRMAFVMPRPVVKGPKLDDGDGGDGIGKHNHNGGGGDDGGDDDDDYFADDDGEGEGEGDGFFRTLIGESYDKFSIACVFAEWMRTMADLPLILRRAVEMGLFSSAQLVRFFSMDVRPSLTRSVSRALPPTWARDFVGRLMADPAFVQKMVVESSMSAALSLYYEYSVRGDKFLKELDLALINTVGMAAATGATTWLVAPTRSYGSVHKFPWQQMLDGLPNCVFDTCGPLRQYTNQARVGGFLAKMAELSAVGAVMGTTTSLLSTAAVALRKRTDPAFEPSVPIPSVGRSSAGLAAFFAINANSRYQLLGGMDRFLIERSQHLWSYLAVSGFARAVSQGVGELSRPWWQGLPQPAPKAPTMVRRRVARKVTRRVPRSTAAAAAAPAAPVAVGLDEMSTSYGGELVVEPLELSASASYVQAPQVEAMSYESAAAAPEATPASQAYDALLQQQQMAAQAAQQQQQQEESEAPRYRRSAPQGRRQSSM